MKAQKSVPLIVKQTLQQTINPRNIFIRHINTPKRTIIDSLGRLDLYKISPPEHQMHNLRCKNLSRISWPGKRATNAAKHEIKKIERYENIVHTQHL